MVKKCLKTRTIKSPLSGFGLNIKIFNGYQYSVYSVYFPVTRALLPIVYEITDNDEFEPKFIISFVLDLVLLFALYNFGATIFEIIWAIVLLFDLIISAKLLIVNCAPDECVIDDETLELIGEIKKLSIVITPTLLTMVFGVKLGLVDINTLIVFTVSGVFYIIFSLKDIYMSKAKLTIKKFICWYLYA